MATAACARHLMGTRFEILVSGSDDPARLRAAAEEALDEIERLDRQLSLYRPDSELADLNRRGGHEWVRLEPRLMALLQQAVSLSRATRGAFDPTVAPLLAAWGFIRGSGRWADDGALAAARALVGPDRLVFDDAASAARFDRPGAWLDLGAIGKGYALDRAAAVLREDGITSALLHGGTSTVAAIGSDPAGHPWSVAVADPADLENTVAAIDLPDGGSLSVSAVHGKAFTGPDGQVYGHVLDPRSGQPVRGARLTGVALPSATETDALSTALLVLGEEGLPLLEALWPEASALVIMEDRKPTVLRTGFTLRDTHDQGDIPCD